MTTSHRHVHIHIPACWNRNLLGLALLGIAGCSGGFGPPPLSEHEVSSSGSDSSKQKTTYACEIGLTDKVRQRCGCSDYMRFVDMSFAHAGLSDNIRLKTAKCLNNKASASWLAQTIKAELDACVSQSIEVDPSTRDALIKSLDSLLNAKDDTRSEKEKAWTECYQKALQPDATSADDVKTFDLRASRATLLNKATADGKQLYEFKVWIAGIDDARDKVDHVEYLFDHPSFEGTVAKSGDVDHSWGIRYEGWGCVDRVTVSVKFKDASRITRTLSQCKEVPQDTPHKGPPQDPWSVAAAGNPNP